MSKKFNQYLGKAGHLAVMSEFLMRGWNVAIPEVDIGDDIFVVQDEDGTLRRVQVKTSSIKKRQHGFSTQFQIPLKQLRTITNILVQYVFIDRHQGKWTNPIIIRQDFLLDHIEKNGIDSQHTGTVALYFSYQNGKVKCADVDFSRYVNDYSDFPIINH